MHRESAIMHSYRSRAQHTLPQPVAPPFSGVSTTGVMYVRVPPRCLASMGHAEDVRLGRIVLGNPPLSGGAHACSASEAVISRRDGPAAQLVERLDVPHAHAALAHAALA